MSLPKSSLIPLVGSGCFTSDSPTRTYRDAKKTLSSYMIDKDKGYKSKYCIDQNECIMLDGDKHNFQMKTEGPRQNHIRGNNTTIL